MEKYMGSNEVCLVRPKHREVVQTIKVTFACPKCGDKYQRYIIGSPEAPHEVEAQCTNYMCSQPKIVVKL